MGGRWPREGEMKGRAQYQRPHGDVAGSRSFAVEWELGMNPRADFGYYIEGDYGSGSRGLILQQRYWWAHFGVVGGWLDWKQR
jgi:hypothetical protein